MGRAGRRGLLAGWTGVRGLRQRDRRADAMGRTHVRDRDERRLAGQRRCHGGVRSADAGPGRNALDRWAHAVGVGRRRRTRRRRGWTLVAHRALAATAGRDRTRNASLPARARGRPACLRIGPDRARTERTRGAPVPVPWESAAWRAGEHGLGARLGCGSRRQPIGHASRICLAYSLVSETEVWRMRVVKKSQITRLAVCGPHETRQVLG